MKTESLILAALISLTIVLIINIISKHSIAIKTINFSMLELQLKTPVNSQIVDILDGFIEDCFSEYLFLNAQFAEEDRYISDDEEKEIVDGLVTIVSDRISSILYKQLSVYYNENTIPIILSNKIYQLVAMYVVEKNKVKPGPVS